MPDISVVIVNWNVKKLLNECLKSIKKNCSDINYEIIVVDNNSSDGSVRMLEKEHRDIILIKNTENYGYGKANNQGISIAKGKYVLILNPDTIVLPDCLEYMYDFLENNPRVAVCGPTIIDSFGQKYSPMIYLPTAWELFGKDTFLRKVAPQLCLPVYSQPEKKISVERLSGCCFLCRKKALKDVEAFDEKIFLFFEEADLFYRIKIKGWEIYYLPEYAIIHHQGKSLSRISRFQEEILMRKSSLIYFQKKYNVIINIILKLFLIFSYTIYMTIFMALFSLSQEKLYFEKKKFYSDLFIIIFKNFCGMK
jgi:hypothetical protein